MKLSFLIRREFYSPLLLGSTLLLFAGCGKGDDSKITVYRIPKETQPAASPQEMAMTSAAPNAASNAAPAGLHWTAPSGWEEQPATGFRKGSFIVRGCGRKNSRRLGDFVPGSSGRRAREREPLAQSVEAFADLERERSGHADVRSPAAKCFSSIS